jgi:hypothetical protein
MVSDDIRRLAKALGVTNVKQTSLGDLIRTIQFQEGHMPCFSETWSAPCGIEDCPFADVCTSHLPIRAAIRH